MDALTFDELTDISLAVEKGHSDAAQELAQLSVGDLGPFVEMVLRLEAWQLRLEDLPSLGDSTLGVCLSRSKVGKAAFESSSRENIGVLKLDESSGSGNDLSFTGFGICAKNAAVAAGAPPAAATSLIGAIQELRDNVVEHSGRPRSGIVAYVAASHRFEFCVADAGKGVLASLREHAAYASLTGSGEALRTALRDGESRFGPGTGRGYGFRELFRGMQKIPGTLHFKSGDHQLEHEGSAPSLGEFRLSQCAELRGFLISAICLTSPRTSPRSS